MRLYSENENYKLYQGNMLDMLEVIEPNSIDSIVTDPPYELNFMSKGWDNSGIAFQPDTWKKCYEVLKSGGYLLAFGGSRTFHRIACAIEDAGFEIRDTICYMYGSGFPKSQNIGKQLEKRYEDEKTKQKTEHDLLCMWERNIQKTKSNEKEQENILFNKLQEQSMEKSSNTTSNVWGKESSLEGWSNIQKTERELQWCQICEMSKRVFINGEERWICNGTQNCDGEALRKMFDKNGSCPSYRPQPEQQFNRELNAIQEQWGTQACREVIENWKKIGTALKPSFEPIIVARKPFKGSLVDNIIENGVGGINIDECRVGNEERFSPKATLGDSGIYNWNNETNENEEYKGKMVTGRFPANTILTYDETDFDEVCGGFPYTKTGTRKAGTPINQIAVVGSKNCNYTQNTTSLGDSGSASRYFMNCKYTGKDEEFRRYIYTPKASKKDRDEGLDTFVEEKVNDGRQTPIDNAFQRGETLRRNVHPCVKPTNLMQYLVRLVTPNNGTVLDPFNGSGSTGKAVMYENHERDKNYKYVGIELTEEYLPISKARIEYVCNLPKEQKQSTIFDYLGDDNNE